MPVTKCFRETPDRIFRLWQEWRLAELNNPSRSDHYLMQINSTLEAMRLGKSPDPNLDGEKIKFRKVEKAENQEVQAVDNQPQDPTVTRSILRAALRGLPKVRKPK